MDHAIDGITASEGMLDGIGVPHIPFNHVDGVGSCQLLNPVECLWRAVVEVVQNYEIMALLKQPKTGMAADEAGSAGDQHAPSQCPNPSDADDSEAGRRFEV